MVPFNIQYTDSFFLKHRYTKSQKKRKQDTKDEGSADLFYH